LPEILFGLLYTYLHPLSGVDEVGGKSWQSLTAVHDEGVGLTLLSDSHKVMTAIGLVILPSECCCGVSLCNLVAVFNLKASLTLIEASKPVAGS
jgi:hypothetical protein